MTFVNQTRVGTDDQLAPGPEQRANFILVGDYVVVWLQTADTPAPNCDIAQTVGDFVPPQRSRHTWPRRRDFLQIQGLDQDLDGLLSMSDAMFAETMNKQHLCPPARYSLGKDALIDALEIAVDVLHAGARGKHGAREHPKYAAAETAHSHSLPPLELDFDLILKLGFLDDSSQAPETVPQSGIDDKPDDATRVGDFGCTARSIRYRVKAQSGARGQPFGK